MKNLAGINTMSLGSDECENLDDTGNDLMKSFIFLSLFLGLSAAVPFGAVRAASPSATDDIGARIDISGRQRTLSQQMAGAACMRMAGVDIAGNAGIVAASVRDFESALGMLRDGEPLVGLDAEQDQVVLAELDRKRQLWREYGPAIQQLGSGDMHPVAIRQVMKLNLPMLVKADNVVQSIVRQRGSDERATPLAKTINVAGRQRMLSQKMSKAACFLGVGLDVAAKTQSQRDSIALFETSLAHLLEGDAVDGIAPPPSDKIAAQLRTVEGLWREYRGILEQIDPQAPIAVNRPVLEKISNLSRQVLQEMHKAVLMYVATGSERQDS